MKKSFNELLEKFIVKGYERTGLMYGNYMSYLVYDVNPRWLGVPFSWFEKKYFDLGYELISENTWMLAGGYGAIDEVKLSLRVHRSDGYTLSPGDIQKTKVEYTLSDTEENTTHYTIKRNMHK